MTDNRLIVKYARDLKHFLNTNDPYEIAEHFGIQVMHTSQCSSNFTAHTIKLQNYPTIISINSAFSTGARRILCAHELGHALLHSDGMNHFAITNQNVLTNVELEANLFAIALLANDNINDSLEVPLEKMDGYLLKTIIEYNLG